jgi:HEAT repeat protein
VAVKRLGRCSLFKRARLLGVIVFLVSVGGSYESVFSDTAAVADEAQETQRAEALIPLLEGRQEFWAIGEFVHLGPPGVPVLAKALNHPSRRVRLNAIEALSLIKDKSALAALNAVAANPSEIPAVREKALRVAIRLDPENALPALEAMAGDPDEAIRHTVVSESRQIKSNAVIELLIPMLGDDAPSVADGALRTLHGFTGRLVERQDFLQSTKDQRLSWSKEWAEWWKANRDTFNSAPQRPQSRGF